MEMLEELFEQIEEIKITLLQQEDELYKEPAII